MAEATPQPTSAPAREALARGAFLLGLAFCFSPWASPALALAIGVALALAGLTAWPALTKKASRFLIQLCVVLLGFRMDLGLLLHTAREGLLFAAGTIIGTMALGYVAGRVLKTGREISLLISSGTAVCGGSAIAAVGGAIAADAAAMAVATGTVFILNAVALYLFPVIGHALHLTPAQFGTWAGVAIHDVSSVVGAAKSYHVAGETGPTALDVANVVKLSRVLWIIPLVFYARRLTRDLRPPADPAAPRRLQLPIPWFIVLFLAASLLRSLIPQIQPWADTIKTIAGYGFQAALFLIGAGLSMKAIRSVGWRALAQGILLWIVISVSALLVVLATVD